jgi:hypothetical protein
MVTTRVKPRGPFYACKHARTHPRVFVDIWARIPAKMVVVICLSIRWRSKPVVRLPYNRGLRRVEVARIKRRRIMLGHISLCSPSFRAYSRAHAWVYAGCSFPSAITTNFLSMIAPETKMQVLTWHWNRWLGQFAIPWPGATLPTTYVHALGHASSMFPFSSW